MKALLIGINSKYIHTNLALRDIVEYGKDKTAAEVSLVEFTINQRVPVIVDEIYRQRADVLLFSCYIWNIEFVEQIIATYRKIAPAVKIVVGGPEVSYHSTAFMHAHPAVDVLMKGEGEDVFVQLMNALLPLSQGDKQPTQGDKACDAMNGNHLKGHGAVFAHTQGDEEVLAAALSPVLGLRYRVGDVIYKTADAPPFPMEKLPFPYADLDAVQGKILYFESSRGCPFRCSYCLSSLAGGVRLMPLEKVFAYLSIFLAHNVPQVKFVDRTFNCNKAHALAIWRFLKEHDNGITNFHFEVSAHLFDEETLVFLQTIRPEQFQFEVGVQSTNPDTIAQIQRTTDTARLLDICVRIDSYQNIHQHLDLIAGLPHEDIASFERSFNTVFAIRPQQLQLGFLKILKGSLMEREAAQHEMEYTPTAPFQILKTKWLHYDEILRLKGVEEMVERFYNSGRFRNILQHLIAEQPSAYAFFEQFGAYYFAQGYHLMALTKERTHSLLKAFYEAQFAPYGTPEIELAFFDMCLNEKPKKLPDWVGEQRRYDHKREISTFFGNEENIARYLPQYLGEQAVKISRLAHLQAFACDVTSPTLTQGETYVLFDYTHVDLLGNATWQKIPVEHIICE